MAQALRLEAGGQGVQSLALTGRLSGSMGMNTPVASPLATGACLNWRRRSSIGCRQAQPSKWSLTIPMACMNAYIVVGPTNVQPRFFKALDKRTEAGEVGLPVQ